MTNRREGREGREREGERDRERGSRAKPGIQLVYLYNTNSVCLSVKYRRPNCWTDHDQIWHAYADRPGNGSYQKLTP